MLVPQNSHGSDVQKKQTRSSVFEFTLEEQDENNVPTKQLLLFFSSTWLMLRTLQMENLLLLSLSPDVALAYMI